MIKNSINSNIWSKHHFTSETLLSLIQENSGNNIVTRLKGNLIDGFENMYENESTMSDFVLLNFLDNESLMYNKQRKYKKINNISSLFMGRVFTMNLEEIDNIDSALSQWKISEGRLVPMSKGKPLKEIGVEIMCIKENEKFDRATETIYRIVKDLKGNTVSDVLVIFGKMYNQDRIYKENEEIISKMDIDDYIEAGADVILLPAPGLMKGLTIKDIMDLVSYVHSKNKIAMTYVDVSKNVLTNYSIRDLAFMSKLCGADIHYVDCSSMNNNSDSIQISKEYSNILQKESAFIS